MHMIQYENKQNVISGTCNNLTVFSGPANSITYKVSFIAKHLTE